MQKHIVLKLLTASTLALSAAAFAAPSGSNSGSSGSAGLGIDTGIGGSIASVTPYISLPGAQQTPGMGGPIQGVADLNAKKENKKQD